MFALDDGPVAVTDWWPPLAKAAFRRILPASQAIEEPADEAQLAELVRACAVRGQKVAPVGGGSNVVGALARAEAVTFVSTRRLDRVLEVDRTNLYVRCQSGVLGSELEHILNQHGLTLGHFPQSLELSTVGGWIALRSSGTWSGRYGGIERLLIGLRAVLADGTIVATPCAPRAAAGPDLAALFVGYEGQLGIISEVTMRVVPQTETSAAAWALPNLATGLEVIRSTLRDGIHPGLVRLYDAEGGRPLVEAAGGSPGAIPLLVAVDGDSELADLTLALVGRRAKTAGGTQLAGAFEHWASTQYDVPAFLLRNREPGFLGDAIDVAAWWSSVLDGYEAVRKAIFEAGAASCSVRFPHHYDQGCSIYFVIGIEAATDDAALTTYFRVWSAAMDACKALGLSITHHHGIGAARDSWISATRQSSDELFRRLVSGADPAGVLDAGNVPAAWPQSKPAGQLNRPRS